MSSRATVVLWALVAAAACQSGERETFVTYFDGGHGVSVRHPSGWRNNEAEQDGIWYRYFLAPPTAPDNTAAVSVTLLAGPMSASVQEYAESYLAGNEISATEDEERQGASGHSWTFSSPDGSTRQRLLLVARDESVFGLYAQGEARAFEDNRAVLDEMWGSFALERPDLYPVQEFEDFGVSLGVPESWPETRQFSGRGTLLVQFTSPALSVQQGQTVHASLTMTVEKVAEDQTLDEFYSSSRERLGDNLLVMSHAQWGDGYVDVIRTETSVAMSYAKRFYRVANGRGVALAFEGRDDVFWRIDAWANLIASTLQFTGSESTE